MSTRSVVSFCCGIACIFILNMGIDFVYAQSVEQLQQEKENLDNRLTDIEKEIAEYEAALLEVGAEKQTLQKAINQLELERKKVQADVTYTENKIASTDLEINKLEIEIDSAEDAINRNEDTIREILRTVHVADEETLIEILLRQENLSEFWSELQDLETVRETVYEKVADLAMLQKDLGEKKELTSEQREALLSLKQQYADQHSILQSNKNTKAKLLSETKNEEATYQTLLEQQEAAREQLLAEVQDIESQIQFILDPNSIPTAGDSVFIWPVENPYITQYFGYTKFALSGAYNGSVHNGVDLGAPTGTKISAPLSGTVRMIGNTDAVPGCYSWGKWVLIDHPNGLSSMFAHLSQQSVTPGQQLQTGDLVGYVGSTGYSTGPHLHYTLYVTEGVSVKKFSEFKAVTGCGAALSPFAAIEAYLDPLDYLPTT